MNTDPQHDSPEVPVDRREVRRRRQLAGLTQVQLAEKAGVSHGYIGHIERGIRPRVSPPVFARLCDALDAQDRQELMARTGVA